MEPVSQALLGAASAEIAAGRRLGRRAMLWGALIGMSPDLDVLAAPLHQGYGEWLYHRGTTHSLWFGFAVGPAIGWLLWRWRDRARTTPLSAWVALAVAALVTHPLLDGFTPYGTQLFAPFWRERFAWNGIGIIDPIYTLPLAVGVVIAAFTRDAGRRRGIVLAALGLTTAYLFAGVAMNRASERAVAAHLAEAGSPVASVRAWPTVLQPWLRGFVARDGPRVLVGLHNLLSSECPTWTERRDAPRSPLVQAVLDSWEGGLLRWFAMGEIGVEELRTARGIVVRVDDLRYAWGSPIGRGMWGVEQHFDLQGRATTPVLRFSRRGGVEPDALFASMGVDPPRPRTGWSLPARCSAARRPQ